METGEAFYDLDGELWIAIQIDHKWNGEWVLAEIADGDARYWLAPWETNHVAAQ